MVFYVLEIQVVFGLHSELPVNPDQGAVIGDRITIFVAGNVVQRFVPRLRYQDKPLFPRHDTGIDYLMDYSEEIKRLQKQVQGLSEKIEELSSIVRADDENSHLLDQSHDEVEVIDFIVKRNEPQIIGGDWFSQGFSFKVQIKNKSSVAQNYSLAVIFEDEDGFELQRDLALVCKIIGTNQTLSESGIVNITNRSIAESHKGITCYLESFPI